MGIRGVWSLENVELKKPQDDWVPLSNVYLKQDDIAHSRPMPVTNLQRWNLGTSTMSDSGLACSRYWGQASGNTTFSYFVGGGVSPGITGKTNTDKLSYSPYTFAATPTANATVPIRTGGALSSNLAAYITAGYNPAGPPFSGSSVDKILFATDTKSTLSDKFDVSGTAWASASDGVGGGYNFSGDTPSPEKVKTYKITYATDGMAYLPGSNTTLGTTESSAEMMSRTAGYKAGGATPSTISNTEKLSWSTTTWSAVPSGNLARATRRMASGTGRSKAFAGGGDGNVSPVYTDMYKLDFSTEIFARDPALNFSVSNYGYYPNKSTTTPLDGLYGADKATDRNSFWSGDYAKKWSDNASEPPNSAYGTHGNWSGNIYKFDFASTTLSLPFGPILPAPSITNGGSQRYRAASMSSSSAGYISGGNTYVTPSSAVNTQNKITYSTDVNANLPGSTIPDSRWGHAGFADASQGWYWGGNAGSGGGKSSIFKTVFSTDAVSTIPAQIAADTYMIDSTSSATAGYTFGGVGAPTSSDKLTFATETTSFLPGFSPSSLQAYGSSTGTQTAGYVTAGGPAISIVAKVTWATETSENIPATLTSSRGQTYAVGNTTDGFIGGGSPGGNARIDNINYSSETIAVVPSWAPQPMYTNSEYGTGTGARNKGIPVNLAPTVTLTPTKAPGPSFDGALWMGGYNAEPAGGVVSSGGKIEFSTDTVTELPGTNLSGSRYALSATAAIDAGYYGQAQTTQVIKVTYGTATPSVLPGGLSGGSGAPGPSGINPYDPRRRGAAFGPKTEGYMMQGSTGWSGSLSNFDRIVYATEVISRLPGSDAPDATYATSGTSNQTTGYMNSGAAGSTMRKLPFATLSWTNAPGASFSMWDGRTFANATHGFWVGSTGNNNGSQLQKLVFSSDTASRIPGANFPFSIRYGWGSGNSTYGWCSGGGGSAVDTKSNFYKLNYSNDTWSTASATTSQKRNNNAAAGARQSGMEAVQVPGANPVII